MTKNIIKIYSIQFPKTEIRHKLVTGSDQSQKHSDITPEQFEKILQTYTWNFERKTSVRTRAERLIWTRKN